MRKIFKYEIALVDGLQRIKMPKNAKVLSFQNQTGTMQIWVLLNPDEKQQEDRCFVIIGTGHPIQPEDYELSFVGTAQQGPFVWHLFEVCYN